MNTILKITSLILLTFGAFLLQAQEKPKPVSKPELTVDVKLDIRNAQWEQTKVYVQLKQLDEERQRLTEVWNTATKQLEGKLATALERSGIDKEKYSLNGDTLTVIEKSKSEGKKP